MFNQLMLLLISMYPRSPEGEDFDEPDVDVDIDTDDGDVDVDTDTDDGENEEHEEVEEVKPKISRREQEIIKLRERAQQAEAREAEKDRLLSQARQQPTQQPNPDREIWEAEEAVLRNPNASEWEKYAVQGKREAREARVGLQRLQHQTIDMQDKAQFDAIKTSNPKMYEKYAGEVEKMLQQVRASGNNAPRTTLLDLCLGRDLREGKLKSAEAKTPKVNRGTLPNAKSTATGKSGSLSPVEAARRRLEGRTI